MIRFFALALTFLTGFSGLVYEVVWQKYLAILLGSHSEATAAVLALFLGGLAVGYAGFGRLTRRLLARAVPSGRPPRLLVLYGGVEAAIGGWALVFPMLFRSAHALSLHLPTGGAGIGFVVDVALAALLIGPPAVLMGGTIPILTQALARSIHDATRLHAFVYAFNTAGAFVGALAAGFLLVPALGLVGVLAVMGVVNLAVGAAFAGMPRGRRVFVSIASDAPASFAAFPAYAGVALLSGFAMMAIQTVLIRMGGLSFGSSEFTFAMVVAVFVLAIALGSFAVSALSRIPDSALLVNQWVLVLLLLALYVVLPQAPYWAHVLRTLFVAQDAAFLPYHGFAFLALIAVMGPPVLLSGATLPLLFHRLRTTQGDLGAVAGRLYAWNTTGSLIGALLGGYALLFWLDLHHVYRVAVGALAVGSVILATLVGTRRATFAGWVFLALAGGALFQVSAWDPRFLAAELFRLREPQADTYAGPNALMRRRWRGAEILFYDDGPATSVAVIEFSPGDGGRFRSLLVNGKVDGATRGDTPTTGLLGLLPALFADTPERAFVIGYGTGHSAGELAALDATREIVVAEISTAVMRAAPLFDFANHGTSRHSKVRIVRSDAYRALRRSPGRFDVIVSEPSNPWVTGVEMLYSREFLEAARRQLTPGGVYAQWFHHYEVDADSLALVLRTYAAVFDRISVWYGSGSDLILLGFAGAGSELDLDRLQARAAQPDFAAGLRRAEVASFPALLAHELLPVGVVHVAGLSGQLHTLTRPLLNHRAGRAFFRGDTAELPFTGFGEAGRAGARNSLLRRYTARTEGALPAPVWAAVASEACRHRSRQCTTLLAERRNAGDTPEAWHSTLMNVASGAPDFGDPVDPVSVRQLAGFFADAAFESEEPISPAAAERATRMFEAYYQHSAPFDARRLVALWARCRPQRATDDVCRQGIERARSRVSPNEVAEVRGGVGLRAAPERIP